MVSSYRDGRYSRADASTGTQGDQGKKRCYTNASKIGGCWIGQINWGECTRTREVKSPSSVALGKPWSCSPSGWTWVCCRTQLGKEHRDESNSSSCRWWSLVAKYLLLSGPSFWCRGHCELTVTITNIWDDQFIKRTGFILGLGFGLVTLWLLGLL